MSAQASSSPYWFTRLGPALSMLFVCTQTTYAETLYLKNGKKVEAKIVSQDNQAVVVDWHGVNITYWRDQIERIDEADQASTSTAHATQSTASPPAIDSQAPSGRSLTTPADPGAVSPARMAPVAASPPSAQVKWKYAPPGLGRGGIASGPQLDGSQVYFRTSDGRMVVLDAASGEERWSCTPKGRFDSGPTLVDGQGYYGAKDGRLVAFRPQTCEVVWSFVTQEAKQMQTLREAHQRQLGYVPDLVQEAEQFGLKHSVISDPVAVGSSVYFSFNAAVYAVDAKTGEQQWRFQTGSYIVGRPVIGEEAIYVSSQDGALYAFAKQSGTVRWRYASFERDWPGQPALDGGWVVASPPWGPIYVFNAANGALERQISTEKRPVDGDLITAQGTLYVTIDHVLHAVELTTGRRLWKSFSEMGMFVSATGAPPWISESVLYATDGIGHVVAIDRATGQKQWTYKTEGPVFRPLDAHGVVYAASQDGTLCALTPPAAETSAVTAMQVAAPVIEPTEESKVLIEHSPAFRWKFAPQNEGMLIPPIIESGQLYLMSGREAISTSFYSIASLDSSTGANHAEFTPGGEGLRVADMSEQGTAFVFRFRDTHPKAMIVQAMDIQSGAPKWQHEFPGEPPWVRGRDEGPFVDGGMMYLQSATGELHALDAATGAVRWTIPASQITSGPSCIPMRTALDAMLLSLCRRPYNGTAEAFDITTGALRWRLSVEGPLWQTWRAKPSAAGVIIYLGSGEEALYGRLYAIKAATGSVVWKATLDSEVVSTAVVDSGRVFVGCRAGHLHALDQASGAEQWNVQLASYPTQAVVADGSVFVGVGDDYRNGGL